MVRGAALTAALLLAVAACAAPDAAVKVESSIALRPEVAVPGTAVRMRAPEGFVAATGDPVIYCVDHDVCADARLEVEWVHVDYAEYADAYVRAVLVRARTDGQVVTDAVVDGQPAYVVEHSELSTDETASREVVTGSKRGFVRLVAAVSADHRDVLDRLTDAARAARFTDGPLPIEPAWAFDRPAAFTPNRTSLGLMVYFVDPSLTAERAWVQLSFGCYVEPGSPDAAVPLHDEAAKILDPDDVVVTDEQTTVDGRPAWAFVTTRSVDGHTTTLLQTLVVRDGNRIELQGWFEGEPTSRTLEVLRDVQSHLRFTSWADPPRPCT